MATATAAADKLTVVPVEKYLLVQPNDDLWFAERNLAPNPSRPLPKPTRDLAVLKADLDAHGFCFIADALPPDQVARMKQRVKEQLNGEVPQGHPTGRRSLSNLLNKGDIFQVTMTNDLVDQALEHVLGPDFLLSALTAIQSVPGSKASGLHFDQARMGMYEPAALVANAVYMLDDFTEENGGTRLYPGSHLWPAKKLEKEFTPSGSALEDNPPGTIAAQGPAGTCMVFEGRLLHATGKNTTVDQTRIGVFTYYCRAWVRQLENPFLGISDDVMEKLPARIRARLGYKAWNAFGGYQGPGLPPPMDVVRPKNQIREIK